MNTVRFQIPFEGSPNLTFCPTVQQSVFTVDISKSLPATFAVLREDFEAHGNASKVMVFFPTARSTAVAAEVFRNIKGLPPVFEIHSRKSQPARSKASEEFKNAKSAILFSSDVAARGMDFPG
jgi:ATP-dependent RNA helicase MSS116